MKLFKIMFLSLVLTGSVVLWSTNSIADEANDAAKIGTFKSAAAALLKTNPDLSVSLSKLADEEASEKKQKKYEGDDETRKLRRESHLNLFKTAAAALSVSNPKLSEDLTKLADELEQKIKTMDKNAKQEEKKITSKEMLLKIGSIK